MAQVLNVPVVIGSEVPVARRKGRIPVLDDLKEYSPILDYADSILFVDFLMILTLEVGQTM